MCNWYSMRPVIVTVVLVSVLFGIPFAAQAHEPVPTSPILAQDSTCVYAINFEVREGYRIPSSMVIRFGITCLSTADYVTFDVSTQDITAQANVDYVPVAQTNLRATSRQPAPEIPLTALPDAIAEPNETLYVHLTNVVFHAESGATTGPFASASLVTILDLAPPAIEINPEPIGYPTPNCATSEGGGTCQFDLWLRNAPAADVTFNMSIGRFNPLLPPEAQLLTGALVFNASNYATHQTVRVLGLDDAVLDDRFYGGTLFTVVIRVSSADPTYNGISIVYNGVNLDNDSEAHGGADPTAPVSTDAPVGALTDMPASVQQEYLLVLTADIPVQVYDSPAGSPIHLDGNALFLPADSDHNGYDTYRVMDLQTVDGVVWIGIYIGSDNWGWLPVIESGMGQ